MKCENEHVYLYIEKYYSYHLASSDRKSHSNANENGKPQQHQHHNPKDPPNVYTNEGLLYIDSYKFLGNSNFRGGPISIIFMEIVVNANSMYFFSENIVIFLLRYGYVRAEDQWNGIMGDLVSGSADMSFAPLSVSK